MVVVMLTNSSVAEASPLRLWGDISSVYRTRDFDEGESRTADWLNMSSINASSYIWQPWFALINGGLTLSLDDFDATDQQPRKDKYLTGNMQFDLFPTSRFPFSMYANHSRNELDDELFSRDITNTELGLGQQYRSLSGNHHYRFNYKRNYRDDDNVDNYLSDSVLFSSTNQFTHQVLNGDLQFDRVNSETAADETSSFVVTGRQSYNRFENVTVENLLSSSIINSDFINTSSEIESNQFSSLMSWRPSGRKDMNVTGSLRLAELQLSSEITEGVVTRESALQEQDNFSLNINQGLIYNVSDHVFFSESINGSYTQVRNETLFTGNENIGTNYSPDSIGTVLGHYNWSVGVNLNNQHGDIENQQSLNTQLSHSLSQDFLTGEQSTLQTDITQSYNYDYRLEGEVVKTLDHSLSLSWSKSNTHANSVIRFLFTDSRTDGIEDDTNFQLVNLQLSGQFRFNRLSSLTASLTLQQTDQQNSVNRVSNGQLLFVRKRLFQLPRLNFKSELKFSEQQSDIERAFSTFQSEDQPSDVSWKNKLDYMIGRFDARLSLDFIKNDDDCDRLIQIQFTRSFGDL